AIILKRFIRTQIIVMALSNRRIFLGVSVLDIRTKRSLIVPHENRHFVRVGPVGLLSRSLAESESSQCHLCLGLQLDASIGASGSHSRPNTVDDNLDSLAGRRLDHVGTVVVFHLLCWRGHLDCSLSVGSGSIQLENASVGISSAVSSSESFRAHTLCAGLHVKISSILAR
ncbi:hypothetical protein PENTCL1PPCAC_28210, partial [Pristionchus entomophagus]